MKNFKQLYIPIIAILGFLQATAQPIPPNGKTWEKVETLSDEFNNNTLDRSKWQPTHPTWSGRSPSKFNSDNVSVSGGNLRLKSTVKNDQKQGDWVWSSCVTSNTKAMKKGYYSEARIKCSKLSMTTAFWFQGSQNIEIDVIENFGAPSAPRYANHNKHMKTNLHYFVKDEGPVKDLSTPWEKTDLPVGVGDAYYTYGVWWKDSDTVIFYLNGKEVHTSVPKRSFNEDQYMFFDTEVFSWGIGHPSLESLRDNSKNTGLIDWVHTYKLINGNTNGGGNNGGNNGGSGNCGTAWNSNGNYVQKAIVSFNGKKWRWKPKKRGNCRPGVCKKWKDLGSCSSKSINNTTATNNPKTSLDLKVYPNPAKDIITVFGLNSGTPIIIHDLSGKMVINHISKNEKESIDISTLKSGLYVISVAGKNTTQFIKQ